MILQARSPLAKKLSVPSPLVGEGQGGGWPQAITSRISTRATATLLSRPLRAIGNRKHRDSLLPLSPTLPHKGEGSDTDSRLGHRVSSQSDFA
jgi:hypothetical protein